MNNIPFMSYVFIGITSLVLTYATIADSKNELIIEPIENQVSQEEKTEPSYIEKMNPFSTEKTETKPSYIEKMNPFSETETTETKETVVNPEQVTPPPAVGGKKRKTKKSRKNRKKHKKSRKSKN